MSEPARKTMTYRDLRLCLERDAAGRQDAELDMVVTVRVEDAGGELHVGGLYDVEVDAGCGAGCGDDEQLVLDAAQDVEDLADDEPVAVDEQEPVAGGATRWSPLTWLVAIALAIWVVGAIGNGIDWLDRRACRVDGGRVELVPDSKEWRCVGRAVRP